MSVTPQPSPSVPLYTVKLLLLGESSVGKSSLVNRYTNHTFQTNGLLTIGIDVRKIIKVFAGKKIRLQLWDTAGQEKYRTLPSQYYRGIQGILLVYDLTNKDSFVRIEEWFDKIEQNCKLEELVIALVGNKLDLEDHRQVQSQTAELFANDHKMSFRETSAKTNANVEETIESILLAIIKKGVMDVKKEKVVLAGKQEGCRNEENDTCCG